MGIRKTYDNRFIARIRVDGITWQKSFTREQDAKEYLGLLEQLRWGDLDRRQLCQLRKILKRENSK